MKRQIEEEEVREGEGRDMGMKERQCEEGRDRQRDEGGK